jgi:hypothetical protein
MQLGTQRRMNYLSACPAVYHLCFTTPLPFQKRLNTSELNIRQQLVPLIAAQERFCIDSQQDARHDSSRCRFNVLRRNGRVLSQWHPRSGPRPILKVLSLEPRDVQLVA